MQWAPPPPPGMAMQAQSVRLPLATILLLLALQLPHSLQQQQQQAPQQQQVPPAQPQARIVHVSTGQQLADAVAEWGLSGGNTIIQVDSWYISLANVTIQQLQASPGQPAPFSSGNLRLIGQWDGKDNRTIVNAAMKLLTPPLRGATVSISNMLAFNNCEEYAVLPTPQGPSLLRASYVSLVPLSFAYLSVVYEQSAAYVRLAQVASQLHVLAVWRIRMEPMKQLAAPLLTLLPPVRCNITQCDASAGTVLVDSYQSDQALARNITARSISAKDDPMLQGFRDQGMIMPSQFCNGSIMPAELAQSKIDSSTPAWLAGNTGELATALQEVVTFIATQPRTRETDWMPLPLIIITSNASLPAQAQLGPYRWAMVWLGPFNDVPAAAVTAILDLQQGIDTIRLGPTGKLLIQQLTLTGLGSRVLNSSTELDSALSIAAVSPPPGSNPLTSEAHVWMHNVTLMLPARDFLALTILALDNTPDSIRGCVSPDVRSLADELQRGIRGMSAAGVDLVNQRLVLSSYVGWGVNATTLVLVPELPVPQLSACNSQQSKTCGRLTCVQLVAVLVGVLGAVILLVAAAIFIAIRRKKQQEQSRATRFAGQQGNESVPSLEMSSTAPGSSKNSLMTAFLGEQLSYFVPAANSNSQGIASASSDSAPDSHTSEHARQQIELKAMELNKEADKVIITSTIGKGSSGVVFAGQWRGLKVALKTCVFEELPDEDQDGTKCRAVNEAAISASLSHPNIVATYRYDIKPVAAVNPGDQDTLQVVMGPHLKSKKQHPVAYKLFLVQEFCDFNFTFILAHRMLHHKETRAVDWYSLLRLLRDIATGLEYLHQSNIVHGDLKPCNILLKWHPVHRTRLVAKLADFGLSNHLQGNATHISNFQAGTPFYVAPEVVKLGRTSPSSDIYALGVIMWEAATGCDLYVQSPGGQVKANPVYPGFPEHILPDIAYVKLMKKCIAPNPHQRPTAADVLKQIQAIIRSAAG